MGKKKKALLMCQSDASWSPRTIRFTKALQEDGYHISVASAPLSRELEVDVHFEIPTERNPKTVIGRRLRRYGYFASFMPKIKRLRDVVHSFRYQLGHVRNILRDNAFDMILVQDLSLLPAVLNSKTKARVLFDAREYYPLQNEEDRRFMRFEKPERDRICAEYLPRCDGMITVSDGLAKAYEDNFGVKPIVIFSASEFHDLEPQPVDPEKIKLVYHGVANLNRGLLNLFDLMDLLPDRFSLDLYLVSKSEERLQKLERLAAENGRIKIHPPVPFDRIIPVLNQYDIGIIFYEPTSFNLVHCMPNKLFEYIQARLAVAIGPSPDMAEFIEKYRCGVISQEFDIKSLAARLLKLTDDKVLLLKKGAVLAAKKVSFDAQNGNFCKLVGQVKCI